MSQRVTYVIMRRDLKMPRGKEIAQACHAILCMDDNCETYNDNLPIICVRAEDEAHLRALISEAVVYRAKVSPVTDAGRTCVKPGTLTCAAIGPVTKGRLPLLSEAKCY